MNPTSSTVLAGQGRPVRWSSWAQIILLPLLCGFIAIAGTFNYSDILHIAMSGLAILVLGQFLLIASRFFQLGWLECSAYLFHGVFMGVSGLAVALNWVPYAKYMLYEPLALAALTAQYLLGLRALGSRPIRTRYVIADDLLTVFTVVCCASALVKFYYYNEAVGSLGGHFAIYTEGDQIRDATPTLFRVLAAAAPLVGVLAVIQPRIPVWVKLIGFVAIALEFVIGSRSRPLFLILSVVVLLQSNMRLTAGRRLALVIGGALITVVVMTVGYLRENYTITIGEFLQITMEAQFGIFEGAVFGADLHGATLVVSQIQPLLAPTGLDSIDTVSKLITNAYIPVGYDLGFGISSSALLENALILGPVLTCISYPLFAVLAVAGIRRAVESTRPLLYLAGVAELPVAMYLWRAEIWQLAVPALKAAPFILVIYVLDALRQRVGARTQTAAIMHG